MANKSAKQLRTPIYRQNIVKGKPLNIGAKTSISAEFPTGLGAPGIYEVRVRVNVALTNTTGTTPLSESTNPAGGLLNFIKQIYFRGDNSDVFVDNLPARPLYKIATLKKGSPPRFDAMTVAAGTYRVDIPIILADPQANRPEDTVLVASRYKTLTLDILSGTRADLLGVVGDSAITATVDIDIVRTKQPWDEAAAPVAWYQAYSAVPSVDAAAVVYMDLERDQNSALKRLYVHSSANGSAGSPWAGTNSDTVLQHLTVASGDENYLYQSEYLMLQDANKDDSSLETVLAGNAMIDFMPDGSNLSALQTDLSQLRLSWANATAPANSVITAVQEHRRDLHAPQA